VSAEQAYGWLRTAGKIRIRAQGREIEDLDLTPLEGLCLEFSDGVMQASSTWEAAALRTLDQLGSGEITITTTKTREVIDAKTGDVRERIVTTTERQLAPSATVLMWRLERRFPQRYGKNAEPEYYPTLSEEERADALIQSLTSYLEGINNDEDEST
jgi:hypothetical protein